MLQVSLFEWEYRVVELLVFMRREALESLWGGDGGVGVIVLG